jgi:hypothetical protein
VISSAILPRNEMAEAKSKVKSEAKSDAKSQAKAKNAHLVDEASVLKISFKELILKNDELIFPRLCFHQDRLPVAR